MAKVYVDHGVAKKLEEKFGCNPITVRRALRGETNTRTAKLIRASAINDFGGTVENKKQIIIK